MVPLFTDIPGIRVGQAEDQEALTGCSVVLCPEGAIAGVDQRGGAPGTRETDALHPMHLVEKVHAVLLAGGSAFGLDAAAGVMQYLEKNGIGFETPHARVPIVPGAILYDLGVGRADIRPDAGMGFKACVNAEENTVREGCHGAGTGASVGKAMGMEFAVKSGIGAACIEIADGLLVGALIAVNAFGDIIEPASGRILAGPRNPSGRGFIPTMDVLKNASGASGMGGNTVIGVIATNAALTKEGANKVAQMAQNGLARTIRPAHSMFDGDTLFTLATGTHPAGKSPLEITYIGEAAAEAAAQAVLRGITQAQTAGGIPSLSDVSA